jgi:hypothetical protein
MAWMSSFHQNPPSTIVSWQPYVKSGGAILLLVSWTQWPKWHRSVLFIWIMSLNCLGLSYQSIFTPSASCNEMTMAHCLSLQTVVNHLHQGLQRVPWALGRGREEPWLLTGIRVDPGKADTVAPVFVWLSKLCRQSCWLQWPPNLSPEIFFTSTSTVTRDIGF